MKREQIRRIRHYEEILDEAEAVMRAGTGPADIPDELREKLRELARYYESSEWKRDFEDDEAGRLPRNLKRGVLSEDGIYDVLTWFGE